MNKKPVIQSQDKYVVRLPDGMRDKLKAEAERNKRSMNAEIVARLEATFHSIPEHMTPEAFNFVMEHNYVNATKVAAILKEALQRVEDLSTGSVRIEDIEGYAPPEDGK
ncbi:Arc family DNA-binding protein [Sinorhizobium meliloti]|uniref:Arc family DNA-binding protein n=1 Tax=Rhizobium meliloti TaxID=382 RepID=UPI00398CD8FD